MNQHEGIQCDVCVRSNFHGCRYKCLICSDYDLCSECFERGLSSGSHVASHPMQSILTRADLALYFGGEDVNAAKMQCLTCPYCGELGLNSKMLIRHMIYKHPSLKEGASPVLCPLCATRSNGNNNFTTTDLPGHLVVEHHLAGPRSLVERIDEDAAAALRNPQPPPSSTQTRRSTSTRSSRSSMDAVFLELMSHLPDVRFDTRASGSGAAGGTNAQALQQIQMQLQQAQLDQHLARRAFTAQLPPDLVPNRERPQPVVAAMPSSNSRRNSSGGRSREAAALALQAAIANETRRYNVNGSGRRNGSNRAVNAEAIDATGAGDAENIKHKKEVTRAVKTEENDKFIMKTFLKNDINEPEHAKRDHIRADRSLFVQALLLSAFSTDIKANEEEIPIQTKTKASKASKSGNASSSKVQIKEEKSKKKKNKKNKMKKQREAVCDATVGQSSSKVSIGTQSLSDNSVGQSKA